MPRLVKSPYSLLAVAIVVQAINDWEDATKLLSADPDDEDVLAEIVDIECFFKSDWFLSLREMAPETISVDILEKYKAERERQKMDANTRQEESDAEGC